MPGLDPASTFPLRRNGLKKVDPAPGGKFDPHLHQAMMEEATAEVPGGTAVRALQAAYQLSGRIARPALAGAAAKGAGEAPAAPSEQSSGASAYAGANGAGAGASVDTRA